MIKGITISEGIGIGKILNIRYGEKSSHISDLNEFNCQNEKENLNSAISAFIYETEKMVAEMVQNKMNQESEILKAHIAFLEDKYTIEQMYSFIDEGKSAENTIHDFFDELSQVFLESEDETMRNRAEDFVDMKERLVGYLLGKTYRSLDGLDSSESRAIILVDELRPSLAALLEKDSVAGVIARRGGYTSHSAIMMRAKDIPTVFGARVPKEAENDILAIVDGSKGFVYIDPPYEVLLDYESREKIESQLIDSKKYFRETYTLTACGVLKPILSNISDMNQAKEALNFGAGGIGLYRTEYLYMEKQPPTEAEQVRIYEGLAKMFEGMEVTIRTLDAGADKECSSLHLQREDNPFLGERGIRFCLSHIDIFKIQIRSLLRAARFGNIRICFPMISTVDEIRRIKKVVEECMFELQEENLEFSSNPDLGIMLETPAACIMAKELADEVDFFSLGTNDLTGYVMAADRGNFAVADLSSMYNPAVIRLICYACEAVHEKKKEISICGEAASDIKLLPLLLGLGIDKFSVSGENIWRVRREISKWKLSDAAMIREKVLNMATKEEVESYLSEIFEGGKKENGN